VFLAKRGSVPQAIKWAELTKLLRLGQNFSYFLNGGNCSIEFLSIHIFMVFYLNEHLLTACAALMIT
jgi:hypothetical protein